jgi:hypothetical protein
MSATSTRPTGKRSSRGRLNEGAPTKRTAEIVAKVAYAISLGVTDGEAAGYAGISDMTLTTWRKDPEFLAGTCRSHYPGTFADAAMVVSATTRSAIVAS